MRLAGRFTAGAVTLAAGGLLTLTATLALTRDGTGADRLRPVSADLTRRDPHASANARAVYRLLAGLENAAREGWPTRTILGQHVEIHNELYNSSYGDYRGPKPAGYYYQKVADITGKLPGFVEGDLGPGYDQPGWAVGNPRWYTKGKWPSCRPRWQYTEDVTDLLVAVWDGFPRADDGTYLSSGRQPNCDGTATTLPDNGGGAAGIAGLSFHEPYPGSAVKGYRNTLCGASPAGRDAGWFRRVVNYQRNTAEYRALISDLAYLADHLVYLAAHDVPVLLRPYHEMNVTGCGGSFWWSGQDKDAYRSLWRIMYDYLVHTRGLHNLIFVWAPSSWSTSPAPAPGPTPRTRAVPPWDYYPGDEYTDVVAVDDYSDSPAAPGDGPWTSTWYRGLADYDKPRMMAETYDAPLGAAQPRTLRDTPWVIWTIWGQALTGQRGTGGQAPNSGAAVKASYGAGSQVVTGGSPRRGGNFAWSELHADHGADPAAGRATSVKMRIRKPSPP